MANQDSKKTNRLPTGMIKRSNPLTLTPTEETSNEGKKVVKKQNTKPTIKVAKPVEVSLSGPKQFLFFLPLFDKTLFTALKNTFPKLSNQALVEKALLTLLKEARPNTYDDLIKSNKK
jgi:hypothetical protein